MYQYHKRTFSSPTTSVASSIPLMVLYRSHPLTHIYKNVYTSLIHTGINPMDNLKVQELKTELESRGVTTQGKKRPQLESEFVELRRGIVNVAALLQSDPDSSLSSLCLDRYEVLPTEPLHDVKGHLSNIMEETLKAVTGETLKRLKLVSSTVLGKETLCCSDYRKAVLLFYITLFETEPNSHYTTLFQTAAEICERLYADDSKRKSQTVLWLHNI